MPRTVFFPPPSIHVCPDCDGSLTGERCSTCGLVLQGPDAGTLWWIDNELHRLGSQRSAILTKLRRATSAVSTPPVPEPVTGPAAWTVAHAGGPSTTDPSLPPLPPMPPRRVWPPESRRPPVKVQHVLLGLGAFCLVVAAVVFAAVTWTRLGALARGGILLASTAVMAAAASATLRRNLAATAEALAAVAVGLALIDIHAVRVGLFPDAAPAPVWAAGLAVVAGLCWTWARVVPLGGVRLAALAAAQFPVPILAVHLTDSVEVLAAGLLGQAAALVAVLRAGALRTPEDRDPSDWFATTIAVVATGLWAGAAGIAAFTGAVVEPAEVAGSSLVLLAAAALAAFVTWAWAESDDLRLVAGGAATMLLFAAATAALRPIAHGDALVLASGGCAVLVLAVARRMPARWGSAPGAVATVGALGATLPAIAGLASAVMAPLVVLAEPWQHSLGQPSRTLLDETLRISWTLTAGGLALAWAVAGLWADRANRTVAAAVATALVGISVAAVPLVADTSVAVLMSVALGLAVAAAGLAVVRPRSWWAPAAYCLSLWTGFTAVGWGSVADSGTLISVATLGATALVVAIVALRRTDAPIALSAANVALLAASTLAVVVPLVAGASAETAWLVLGLGAAAASVLAPASQHAARRAADGRLRTLLDRLAVTVEGHALLVALASMAILGSLGAEPQLRLVAVVATVTAAVHALRRRRALLLVGAAAGSLLITAPTVTAADSLVVLGSVLVASAGAALLAAARREASVAALLVANAAPVGATLIVASALSIGASGAGAAFAVTVAAGALSALAWTSERWGAHDLTESAREAVARGLATAVDVSAAAWFTAGAVALSATADVELLSLSLLVGVTALALHGLRPTRPHAVWLATALAVVLVWLRLGVADVHLVEAYAFPAAAALLAAGWFHRARGGSWLVTGPGLVVGFAPSLAVILTDPGLWRPLAVGIAATATVLAGTRLRLQAPIAIGAGSLVVVGANQLGPFAAALPRYLVFAALGCILLAVGANFEQRRRDVADARDRFASLG